MGRPPGPVRWERDTKPDGGARRIARLRSADDDRYRRLVGALAPRIERSLGAGVVANRVDPDMRLRPWRTARRIWRRAGRDAVARLEDVVVVTSDVRRCYPSIGERSFTALGIDAELTAFLLALWDLGVVGLPIGPDPSAVLANGVLAIADAEAAAAGCPPLRWVDDVVFVAAGRRSAQGAFDAWRRGLADLGMEANDGKTRWAIGRADALALLGRSGCSAPARRRRGIIAPS